MKMMTTLALMLVSSAAFAMPTVGDTATFNGTYAGAAGGSMNFTQTLSLTAQNPSTKDWTMHVSIQLPNKTQDQDQNVSNDDLLTDAVVKDALDNCDSYGGTAETLTVPAGTFPTCAIDQGDSKIWVAQVPFGIAKEIDVTQDGDTITIELASSAYGQ